MKGNPVYKCTPLPKDREIPVMLMREINKRGMIAKDRLVRVICRRTGLDEAVIRGHLAALLQAKFIEIVRAGDGA